MEVNTIDKLVSLLGKRVRIEKRGHNEVFEGTLRLGGSVLTHQNGAERGWRVEAENGEPIVEFSPREWLVNQIDN